MDDRNDLVALLEQFAIPYEIKEKVEGGCEIIFRANGRRKWGYETKVEGNGGFYTVFEFDAADKFVVVGIWE